MNIGKSLKIALINKGMKSKELAAEMGVSCAHVSAIATGVKIPSLHKLAVICNFLDYKVSVFIALGE